MTSSSIAELQFADIASVKFVSMKLYLENEIALIAAKTFENLHFIKTKLSTEL